LEPKVGFHRDTSPTLSGQQKIAEVKMQSQEFAFLRDSGVQEASVKQMFQKTIRHKDTDLVLTSYSWI
jgi:hypothetical protein